MFQFLLLMLLMIALYNIGSSLFSALRSNSTTREKERRLPVPDNEINSDDIDSKISQLKYELEKAIEDEDFAQAHLKLAKLESLKRDKCEKESEDITETKTKLYSLARKSAEYIKAGVDGFKNGIE